MWLHGWASRTEPMQGISQRIWAKAVALQGSDGNTVVLVTADLLGFSRTMTAAIARRARKKFGLERSQLMLNASHNHSGPVTGDVLPLYHELPEAENLRNERYTRWLLDCVVGLIGDAIADLAPARLAFGQGLAGIAVNRRRARPGGRPLTTAVDPDVPVLSVRSARGALRAIVFGYACHPTCVSDDTLNADFPGWAQQHLEEMYPGAIALFVQGCGGDANPLPRHQPGLGEAYGTILAVAAHQVLQGEMSPVAGPLRTAFAEADLPFEPLPTRDELNRLLKGRSDLGWREVAYQLSLLADGDRRPQSLSYPIHVWRFGEGLKLIGLSSEPVADYSIRLKHLYGDDDTWASGYNDDYWCYIPSLRVWREGGYEGTTGLMECNLPGPFAPSIEEIIVAKVDELMQEASGRRRIFPKPSQHK